MDMKRLVLLMLALLITSVAGAQVRIVEDFENSTALDWSEYADKRMSALVMMGALELKALEDFMPVSCTAELPVVPEYDFKIKAKLFIPKVDDKHVFGVIVDMDEDFNKIAFLFSEDMFVVRHYNNGKIDSEKGEIRPIKLKGGKDRTMELEVIRRGGSYIVNYDNIEVLRWKRRLESPHFGFFTTSHLKVDEVIVEQEYTGQSE